MKIIIYTIDDKDSSFCKDLRAYLQSKNLQCEEKRVDTDRDALAEMQKLSDNFAGVPFTIITKDNGEEVKLKGFTQGEFDEVFNPSAPASVPAPVTSTSASTTLADPMKSTSPVMPGQVSVQTAVSAVPAQTVPVGGSIPPTSPSTVGGVAGGSNAQQNELDKILSELNTTAPSPSVQSVTPAVTPAAQNTMPSASVPALTQPVTLAQPVTPSQPIVPSQKPPIQQPTVPQTPGASIPQMPDFPQK